MELTLTKSLGSNISWALDTQQDTHMISMNFHYYSDVACDMNFDVIIQGALGSYKECEKLTDKIILEQTATFSFRSKNCGDVNEPAKDTITGMMLFVWGVKGQVFNGTVLGGTGKFSGISGEFIRERLLAPNFSGAETFRITFPTKLKPDYFPN